mmetsp:Transcript_31224/g.61637  ORF Transcript_31224/g.61637 Transcript_31224/m.61637 type:complete len:133 (-) Transcript_31224:823-1221(-)
MVGQLANAASRGFEEEQRKWEAKGRRRDGRKGWADIFFPGLVRLVHYLPTCLHALVSIFALSVLLRSTFSHPCSQLTAKKILRLPSCHHYFSSGPCVSLYASPSFFAYPNSGPGPLRNQKEGRKERRTAVFV